MVKKPSQRATSSASNVTTEQAEALAEKLADKPYGDAAKVAPLAQEQLTRASISLPVSLLRQIEDLALENKREGKELRSISAIVRDALQKYLS